MAVELCKIAVTKSMTWLGKTEEFSNVYVVDNIDLAVDSEMNAVCDALVAAEKLIFSTDVTFVRAQLYTFGDFGPNFMYYSETYSGAGALSPTPTLYREACLYIRRKLPRTFSLSRANQPYMRKFLHTRASHSLDVAGTAAPTFAAPTGPIASYVAVLDDLPGSAVLTTESEATPVGNWEVCQVIRHRQFRRGRKEYAD